MSDSYWLIVVAIFIVSIFLATVMSQVLDPITLLSRYILRYEKKLKEMLPPTSLQGEKLIEYALSIDDKNIHNMAKRGALFQWFLAFLASFVLFVLVVIAACDREFVMAVLLLLIGSFCIHRGLPFFRLWRK